MSPVKFNDIADFGGKLIPASTKEQWLQAIGSGTERGGAEIGRRSGAECGYGGDDAFFALRRFYAVVSQYCLVLRAEEPCVCKLIKRLLDDLEI